jgi:hypothetical protein
MSSMFMISVGFGDSMDPTLDSCSVTFNDKVDSTDTIQTNGIYAYHSENYNNNTIHRMIVKEESFDPDTGAIQYTGEHIIVADSESDIESQQPLDLPDRNRIYSPKINAFTVSDERVEELTGETVYIFQGDGNRTQLAESLTDVSRIDPELVTKSQIDYHYQSTLHTFSGC